MKNHIITFFILLSFVAKINAQEFSKNEIKYKPKNLNESINQLNKIHNDSIKSQIRNMTEKEFTANSHFGLGLSIRNNWKLWKKSELSKSFNKIGIYHPDDMSGIILTSYHRNLNEKPIELNEQILYYKKYWKNLAEHKNKMKTDSVYIKENIKKEKQVENKYWDKLRGQFKIGDSISTYLVYQCGLIALGNTSKIKGKVIEIKDRKVKVKILEFVDKRKKKRIIKCNNIENNEFLQNIELIDKSE
tara:strand:- start:87 stop:824 length:738 start_codon:yes stop_codon:yes gene_type:complete